MTEHLTASLPTETLQAALMPITALATDAMLHIRSDGVTISATDPAKIATVTVRLDATAFASYHADSVVVGANVDRLSNFAEVIDPDTILRMNLQADRGLVTLRGDTYAGAFSLIDPDLITALTLPSAAAPAVITVNSDNVLLRRAITAATLCAPRISLGTTTDPTTFYCDATGERDDMSVTFTPEDRADIQERAVRTTVPVDYLHKMYAAIPKDGRDIRFILDEAAPLTISSTIANGDGDVTFVLSPSPKPSKT